VAKSGATCVKTILGDALHFSHHRLPDVEYIVVDPTCSGSGKSFPLILFSILFKLKSGFIPGVISTRIN
jgi:hypothetical protein